MNKIIAALLTLFVATTAQAEVRLEGGRLYVSGSTTMEQVNEVENILLQNDVNLVVLSGPGGLMFAGLKLGYLINEYEIPVLVDEGTACISACAIAAMGSGLPLINGTMYLHRPYLLEVSPQLAMRELIAQSMVVGVIIHEYLVSVAEVPYDFVIDFLTETDECTYIKITSSGDYLLITSGLLEPTYVNQCENGGDPRVQQ